MYQNATGVPNVTTVTNVPKMTNNDPSVPVFGSINFYMAFERTIISPLNFKTANGRHIENRSWSHFCFHTAFWASTSGGFRIVFDTLAQSCDVAQKVGH